MPRSPINKALSWTQQRLLWNQEGYCSREACGFKHNDLTHCDTGLKYCRRCANLINYHNPEKILIS